MAMRREDWKKLYVSSGLPGTCSPATGVKICSLFAENASSPRIM
jgi:hypothetical protein